MLFAALLLCHCATAAAVPTAAAVDQLTLTVLPDALASSAGARCLDSSPGAYYTALGSGADVSSRAVCCRCS